MTPRVRTHPLGLAANADGIAENAMSITEKLLSPTGKRIAERLIAVEEGRVSDPLVLRAISETVTTIFSEAGRDVNDPKEHVLASQIAAYLWTYSIETARTVIPGAVLAGERGAVPFDPPASQIPS